MTGLDELSEQYHRGLEDFVRGDPEPVLRLWSRRDDTTLANPLGPPVRGYEAVREASERAVAQVGDGEAFTVERVSSYATSDLAYEVEVHRFKARLGGAEKTAPVSLRVTTIYRHEDVGWTIVHRHADAITEDRPAESIVQS